MDPTPAILSHQRLHAEPKQIFTFNTNDNEWIGSSPSPAARGGMPLSTQFNIATWNIDFMRPNHGLRYTTAFNYLQQLLPPSESPFTENHTPTIILIQELESEFFSLVLNHPFVREYYDVTDISSEMWANPFSHYGTMTLIPKPLAKYVARVFRTRFPGSKMGREALYVDLLLQGQDSDSGGTQNQGPQGEDEANSEQRYLRIVNVHLESLRGYGDTERPKQLRSTVPYLTDPEIYAGIVAGDMNAIGPHDASLPTQLGFNDAWAVQYRRRKAQEGVTEVTDEDIDKDVVGHTWGFQPVPRRFPSARMDKILTRGRVGVVGVERIGVDVRVTGFGTEEIPWWASDHYGLLGRFRLDERDESA